jgi:hypothetical protein
MPFALGMVRKLAAAGHEIYAADDHALSPGNHSRYLAGHFVYPSPRGDTVGFLGELERIAQDHEIDVIVPTFEEAFYISTQLERLSRFTKVFTSPFSTPARLHDKGAFERLVAQLGLPIPETVLVTTDAELSQATGRLGRYFARAAFSRGGICCLTNTGPLADALDMDEIHPTPGSPWLVQPFVEGDTVCTYARKLVGYAGLAPRVKQSGQRSRSGELSKAGSRTLRWAAVEAAQGAWRESNPWHRLYSDVKARTGKANPAKAAVARKVLIACWHVLSREEPFKPSPPTGTDLVPASSSCFLAA